MPPSAALQAAPPEPAAGLLLYAPDESCARRLTARLPALRLRWENSQALPPLQLARRGGEAWRLVLLDYSTGHAAHSSELARQLAGLMPELPLVAVGSTAPDQAGGVLAALRAGVRDFVDLDAPAEDIQAVLRKAMAHVPAPRSTLAPVPSHKGRLVVLLGVRPGVGASTLAAHLGVLAQQASAGDCAPDHGNRLLLLDLGRPAGDLCLYLSAESDFRYEDALRNAGRIDATLSRTALARHASGAALLGQAADAQEPPPGGAEAAVLVERLRGIFDLLLADLGGLPARQAPLPLLQGADEIWLVADQGIGTLVSLDRCLKDLEQAGLRDARLKLVMNRHDEACGLAPGQVAERFGLPLLATLPERSRTLRANASVGRLLHDGAPRDPYLRALAPLLARLAPEAAPAAASPWQKLAHRLSNAAWKRT